MPRPLLIGVPLSEESRPGGRVAISCAFEENTIRAISRAANAHGVLTTRAVRDVTALHRVTTSAASLAPRADALQRLASKQRSRATVGVLPEDTPIAPLSELARGAGGKFRSPLTPLLGHTVNKVFFDRRASRIDFGDAGTLIGMPGSSLQTFERNRDRVLVFHEIDAHPRVRNELLTQFFGAKHARAEIIPKSIVERIEAELDLSTHVLVPGHVVADQMTANGVPESKLVRVPYGVDPGVFSPKDIKDRRPGPVRVVFTGQVSLRKGVPFLIEAVRGLPVELTIIGQVFDRRLVQNLPENVRVAGILSAAQLADVYAESDLFVLPTIEDCFSLVVAEAAAAGLPVVTTFENGAYELLSARHTVLPAGDAVALRDAIKNAAPLTPERRSEIADESATSVWTTWSEYGEAVLRRLGVLGQADDD